MVVSPTTAMAAREAYGRSPPGLSAQEQQHAVAGGVTGRSTSGASTDAGASGAYPAGSVMAALAASTEQKLQAGMTCAQIFKAQLKYQSAVKGEPAKEKDFKAEVTRMPEPMVFGFVTGGVHQNATPAFDWVLLAADVRGPAKAGGICGGA